MPRDLLRALRAFVALYLFGAALLLVPAAVIVFAVLSPRPFLFLVLLLPYVALFVLAWLGRWSRSARLPAENGPRALCWFVGRRVDAWARVHLFA